MLALLPRLPGEIYNNLICRYWPHLYGRVVSLLDEVEERVKLFKASISVIMHLSHRIIDGESVEMSSCLGPPDCSNEIEEYTYLKESYDQPTAERHFSDRRIRAMVCAVVR